MGEKVTVDVRREKFSPEIISLIRENRRIRWNVVPLSWGEEKFYELFDAPGLLLTSLGIIHLLIARWRVFSPFVPSR